MSRVKFNKISNYEFKSLDDEYGVDENRKLNPYFNSYKFSTVFLGGSGSGKTTSMIRFFDVGVYYSDIIIYIAPQATLESNLVKNFCKKYNVFTIPLSHKTNFKTLFNEVLKGIHKKYPDKSKIIILDDFGGFTKNKSFNDFLSELSSNASRLNANLILLAQQLTNITPQIAGNFNIFAIFCKSVAESQIRSVLKNRTTIALKPDQINEIIYRFKHAPIESKFIPLIVNNNGDPTRQLIYGNNSFYYDSSDNLSVDSLSDESND